MHQVTATLGGGYTITTSAPNIAAQQQQTAVQSATSRLAARNGDLSKCVVELREIVDRLLGGEPQDASKSGPTPVPSGDLGAMHFEIDAHEKMLSMLQYQVNRLRGV